MANKGALVVTLQKGTMDGSSGGNFSITLDWTSGTGGDVNKVSMPIASTYSAARILLNPVCQQPNKILGVIRSIETIPGALGVPATNPPSSSYTNTFLDKYGYDIASGAMPTMSATGAQKLIPATKQIVDSEITLTIDSAGDATQGRVIMEFEEIGGHKF